MRELNLYMRAFNRHLCLEAITRKRILQDLQCELEQRLEQGETWLQIKEGLGEPADFAAKMNQEFVDKAHIPVSPLRWLALGLAVMFAIITLVQKTLVFKANIDFSVCAFWVCIAAFLLLGWCRKGMRIRVLAPLLSLICGVMSWLLLQSTQTGTMRSYLYVNQEFPLSFGRIIVGLLNSGIWLVIVAFFVVLYTLVKRK